MFLSRGPKTMTCVASCVFYKVLLEHINFHIVYGRETETIWLAKPNTFIIWRFIESLSVLVYGSKCSYIPTFKAYITSLYPYHKYLILLKQPGIGFCVMQSLRSLQ